MTVLRLLLCITCYVVIVSGEFMCILYNAHYDIAYRCMDYNE